MLGFDLIHVCRNRRLLQADIIWTYTELEHLGVLAVFRLLARRNRPKLIANCCWLFDRWPGLSRAKRFLHGKLLNGADVVVTFTPEGLNVARQLLPSVRSECILSGALTDDMKSPRRAPVHRPIRIASLGNDMHRDWETLLRAFGNIDRYDVRIASSRINRKLVDVLSNVNIASAVTADEVRGLYEWSDLVVVPLKPNLHASGITVLFESAVFGVPSVCTDTGGLRAYFPGGEIAYVPPLAPAVLRAKIDELSENVERRFTMVVSAQEGLISADLTLQGFARRDRRLSEELLRSSSDTP